MKLPPLPKRTRQIILIIFFFVFAVSIPISTYFIGTTVFDIRNRAEGADATVTIYPDQENYPIEYGTSLVGAIYDSVTAIYADPQSKKRANFIEKYHELGISSFRYPAGASVSVYDWADEKADNLDMILDLADEIDTDVVFELSVMGLVDPNRQKTYITPVGGEVTVRFPLGDLNNPDIYGIKELVKEHSVDRKAAGKKYIKYYELGNEEWGYWIEEDSKYLDPEDYINAAKLVSAAIREVVQVDAELANEIRILGVSSNVPTDTYEGDSVDCGDGEKIPWGSAEYEQNAGSFDNITFHRYSNLPKYIPGIPEGDLLYDIDFLREDLDLYRECMPNTPKFHSPAATEWNLLCWSEDHHRNMTTFEHSLFMLSHQLELFERDAKMQNVFSIFPSSKTLQYQEETWNGNLIYLLEAGGNEFGINPPGKAFEVISKHFGNKHIKTSIDSPITTFHNFSNEFQSLIGGSSSRNDKLYTILVNRRLYTAPDPLAPENTMSTKINIDGYDGDISYTLYEFSAPEFDSKLSEISFKQTDTKSDVDNGFTIPIRNQSAVVLEITLSECSPDCGGKECGPDGCGDTCGTCPTGETCNDSQKCEPTEDPYSLADLDKNGKVDIDDYDIFVTDYLAYFEDGDYNDRSDLDDDGKVNIDDYSLFVDEYMKVNGF